MLITKKAYLAAALTSASLAALAMPTSAWAQATPNVTDECAPAIESSAGLNPEAFDPVTGTPLTTGDTIPDAVQCGIGATASGNGALAIGNGANAAFADSTVIGTDASAGARNTTAIGARAQALFENSVAIGADSIANEDGTVSFGKAADPVTGLGEVTRRLTNVAIGTAATDAVNVGQLNAAVLGVIAGVNPLISIDTTTPPVAALASVGSDAMAIGNGSEAAGVDTVAVGKATVATGEFSVALGSNSLAQGNESAALGNKAKANSDRSTAVGASAEATGLFTSAVGAFATADGLSATAFGDGAFAEGELALAMGSDAKVNATDRGIAIGGFADVAAGATGSIALGTKSKVAAGVFDAVAIGSDAVADRANTVSFGAGVDAVAGVPVVKERQLVNVAAGTQATDAVNKAQLDAATVDDKFLAINPDTFEVVNGVLSVDLNGDPIVISGGVASTTGAGSVAMGANASSNGVRSSALGSSASALGDNSTAVGFNSIVDGANGVAMGSSSIASIRAVSIGAASLANNDAIAVGNGAKANTQGSIAIGQNSRVDTDTNAIAIGQNSFNDVAGTVSFGSAEIPAAGGNPAVAQITRRLTNIGAGLADTDAVNLGQVKGLLEDGIDQNNLVIDEKIRNAGIAFIDVNPGSGAGGAPAANADASVASSVAIGGAATASAANTVALGEGSVADAAGTVSVGNSTLKRKIVNLADGSAVTDAATVGQLNVATAKNAFIGIDRTNFTANSIAGTDAVALGAGTDAAGLRSVAIGSGSITASGDTDVVSFGGSDKPGGTAGEKLTRRLTNVTAGTGDNDAVNVKQLNDKFASVTGGGANQFVAVNPLDNAGPASAPVKGSLAIGGGARVLKTQSIAVGEGAAASGEFSMALGGDSGANANRAIAIGALSRAFDEMSIAIGTSARSEKGGLALGDAATAAFAGSIAIGTESETFEANTVSFGVAADAANGVAAITRRLTNIADGKAASDAATFGQLEALRLAIGAGGGGGAGGGVVAPANLFVAVKEVAGAAPANAAVAGTVALGGASNATLAGAVAIGEGSNALAVNSSALGAGAKVQLAADNSVALGAGSVASEANTVSIGNGVANDPLKTRRLVNLSDGVAGTDAVNVNQLNAVKNLVTTGGVGNGFLAIEVAAADKAANAAGAGSLALGGNSQALAANAVAVGNGAIAKDGAAVSIGLGNTASGNGAVAIGDPNTATGQGAVALGFTNTATGLAAVALGSESQAVGGSAFAQGNKAKAIGFSALALGEGAVAELQNVSNPPSNPAEPNPGANIAIGLGAKAIAQTTIAIGNGAVADAEDATVVGDKSKAAFHATAIGGEVIASGRGSQAFGWQTNALGNTSTALGFRANAVGNGSITVGANTRAEGLNATAIGAGATANFANSTAIGTGAVTTRADQIVLGRKAATANGVTTPGTSVTIADIAASTAAQSGPTDVMTVDAFGTIGRDPSIRASISTLNGQVADLQKGQEELFDLVSFNRKEARRGIAAASALTAAPMPSEPGKTSFVAGTAFYRGEGAFSMSFNHRLNLDIPVAFGGGFAHSGGKDTVVRAHVATEF